MKTGLGEMNGVGAGRDLTMDRTNRRNTNVQSVTTDLGEIRARLVTNCETNIQKSLTENLSWKIQLMDIYTEN